ncbi:MAG TPA: hypothetical protein VKS79_19970 [Gemmataceae bacterium]|nr:hypothetical protein [Gemmataceae bacterium]
MDSVLDIIEKIRARPALILGRPSARILYAYLSGFVRANKNPADRQFLARFGQFVHDRYEITSTQGWAEIIEFYSTSEADEMAHFWKLLDEYLAQGAMKRRKVS